jgi:hypothetical protein
MRSTLKLGSDQRNWKFYLKEVAILGCVIAAVTFLLLSMHVR